MSNLIYGVEGKDGGIIDISNSEKGAKNFATRNGYSQVFSRSNSSCYVVRLIATKKGKRWINF